MADEICYSIISSIIVMQVRQNGNYFALTA